MDLDDSLSFCRKNLTFYFVGNYTGLCYLKLNCYVFIDK